jgi:hypothetical protein
MMVVCRSLYVVSFSYIHVYFFLYFHFLVPVIVTAGAQNLPPINLTPDEYFITPANTTLIPGWIIRSHQCLPLRMQLTLGESYPGCMSLFARNMVPYRWRMLVFARNKSIPPASVPPVNNSLRGVTLLGTGGGVLPSSATNIKITPRALKYCCDFEFSWHKAPAT